MRRLLRVLLIVLLIVLVLAVGLLISAKVYLRSDKVRRQVEERLSEIYGGPVAIDSADISVLGDTTLHGVRLHEDGPEGTDAWASIGTVTFDVSALDLLRGAMPQHITLTDPTITLRLSRSGKSLTRFPESKSTEVKHQPIPAVRIEGGQVTVQQEGRPDMVVKGIGADVQPDGDQVTVHGKISDAEWGNWSIDATADRTKGSLTATLKSDHADVTQDKLERLPMVPPTVWQEVKAHGGTPVEFIFRHDPSTKDKNHYRVILHPDAATIALPLLELTAQQVRGGITIEDGVVKLEQVSGQTLGGELGIDSGTLDFHERVNVLHLVVRAKGIDVGQIPKGWDFDERLRNLGGKLSGQTDLTVTYDGEIHTSGTGHGEIRGVMLGDKPTTIELQLNPTGKGFHLGKRSAAISDTRLAADLQPARVGDPPLIETTLLPVTLLVSAPEDASPPIVRDAAEFIHSALKSAGTAFLDIGTKAVAALPKGDITKSAPATQPPSYLDISVSLQDVDLAKLVHDLGVKVPFPVSGRLTMKVQASLPVDQARDLKSYKVSGTATLPTFTLAGVEMKNVTARVRYDNGILRLEELSAQLDDGRIQGSARLGLIPEGDLTADLTLTDIELAQLMRAAGVKEEVSGSISGSADLRVPAGRLSDRAAWTGSGKIRAARVGAFGWALTDVAAALRLSEGLLTVRDVTAKLEGAPVSGSGQAKLVNPYNYEGQLELAKGDLASLQRLAPALRPPLDISGQFGITARVNGTVSPFTAKVSGSGSGENVKVEKVNVKDLSFDWTIAGVVLKLSEVKATLYDGKVSGSADLPFSSDRDGKLNLRVEDVDVGALVRDVSVVPLRFEGKVSGSIKGTLTAGAVRSFDSEIEFSSPKLRVHNLPTEKLTGTVTYRKGVGEYHLKGALLGGTFDLDGKIPPRPAAAPPAKPAGDSHLRIRGAELGRLGESLEMRGALDQLHGRVDVDVDFRLETPDYLPVGTGDFRVTRLRWGERVMAENLAGGIVLEQGEMRLRSLRGEIGGGTLRGGLTLRLRDINRSTFNISIDAADPARLLAPWPALAANVTGSIDAHLRGTMGRHWHGGGDVVLSRGKVAGVEVADWRVPLRFEMVPARGRAQLDIDDMSAQVGRGRVTGRADVTFGVEMRLEGNLRFYGADLRTLLRPFTDSTTLGSGLTSGRIDFSGNNVRSLDDVTANVEVSFAQTQAFQLPILSQLVPFILPGQSSTTFQSGGLRGRLANGIFRVQRLSLSGNIVNLFAEGTVTTVGRVNLEVTTTTRVLGVGAPLLQLLGLRLPAAGPIPLTLLLQATNYLASASIHLRVSGTVRNPIVRVEPLSLLTEEATRFFLLRSAGSLP